MDKTIEWYRCESQASPERIALVCQEIGVTFPALFIKLMSECDSGWPKKTDFEYYDEAFQSMVGSGIGCFLGFEEEEYSLLKTFKRPREFFPQGLVAFGETGGGDLICFDYRQGKDNPDPEIVYWCHDVPVDKKVSFIAKNFEIFMGMLKEEDDEAFLAKLRAEKDL
jgi:hypothetical protein